MVRQKKSRASGEIFRRRAYLRWEKRPQTSLKGNRLALLPRFFHKKSLCVENAEANSERNLYNPPSGLVLSLHIPVKASFLIRITPFFVLHLKCNIETHQSQITTHTFPAFFCGPIKGKTSVRKGKIPHRIQQPASIQDKKRLAAFWTASPWTILGVLFLTKAIQFSIY